MNCSARLLAAVHEMDLPPEELIFGRSEAMQMVRRQVETAAGASVPVLVSGERGTGKEVVAKRIHSRSPWQRGTFVKVNCPAILAPLLERELFGCERAAFVGAFAPRLGRIEREPSGTLFFDEIAQLRPPLQTMLLERLRNGHFRRIGARDQDQEVLRVICATRHNLAADAAAGIFRRDLFHRINRLAIVLPPLSERLDDLPALAGHLIARYSRKYRRPAPPLTRRVIQLLQARPWPGNIRELESVIKRYVILGSEEAFAIPAAPARTGPNLHAAGIPKQTGPKLPGDAGEALHAIVSGRAKQFGRGILLSTLEANRSNLRLAARALGISYAALLYKMREAGIPPVRGPCAGNPSGQFTLPEDQST